MNWIEEYDKALQSNWKPTKLNNKEEQEFQNWFKNTELFNSFKKDVAEENNIPIDQVENNRLIEMILSSGDYDYRGAYKSKIKEELSPYDNKIHWPSVDSKGNLLKSPTHPTTWKEFFMRQNKIDPDELGLTTIEQAKKWEENQMFEDVLSNPLLQDSTK
jgi:hypothetical protein